MGEIAGSWIPLALVYLAGAARQAGLEAEIYDAMVMGHGYAEIEQHLHEAGADYIAVGAITATIHDAVKILELAKKSSPASVTILGGIHPTFMYAELLGSTEVIDYIVSGEGETTLRLLLEVLRAGGDPAMVAGLAFRRDGAVVNTGRREFIEDLDTLPAAWDLLAWENYSFLAIPGARLAAVSTSRGCDHDCRFCSQQKFWGRSWRARDPLKVADELEYLGSKFQVNVVMITDEYPTRNRERWEALLDAIIARKLPVYLLMETRVGDILRDKDILWKYRKAGIIYISCGVETVGQAGLSARQPAPDPADMKLAFDLLREEEIVSEGSFMLGLPDETPASIKQTMQLAQETNPDVANFLTYTPWPYADDRARLAPLIQVQDYRKYNLVDTVIKPRSMSMLQIDVALAECYRRFYMGKIIDFMTLKAGFRRDYLLAMTRLFMSSSFVIKKLGAGLLGTIPAKLGRMVKREH